MLYFSAKKFFRTLSGIFSIGSILFSQSSSVAQSLVPSVIPIDEEFVAMQYFYLDASLGALGPFFNGEVLQPMGETKIDYMSSYYLTVDSTGNVEGNITGRATGLYFGYFIDILYDGVASTLSSPLISTLDNGFKPITWSFTSQGKYDVKPIEPEPENPQDLIVPLDENRFGSFTDRGEITQTDKDSATISMSIFAYPGVKEPPELFPPLPPISDEEILEADPTPTYVAEVTLPIEKDEEGEEQEKELTKKKDEEKMMGMVSGMVDIGWGSDADEISENTVTGTISVTFNQKDMTLTSEIIYIFSDKKNPPNFQYTGNNSGNWQLKAPEQCLPPPPESERNISTSEISEEYCGMTSGSFMAQVTKVPEHSSLHSLIFLGTLGAATTLKGKRKPSKEKELEKVS